MNQSVQEVLEAAFGEPLINELLEAYTEAKRNYLLGGHRLSAVEGGRFCEAAYRILQATTGQNVTPLGDSLETERVAKDLQRLPAADYPKSVRIYVPRALRVVYDIRNNRDAAHLADGIDPNLQDATLVVSVLDWVLAEFVRLSGKTSADIAQRLVSDLVTRRYPAIQGFESGPKVLRTDLRAGEVVLALLYHSGADGALLPDLMRWVPAPMQSNLRRTIQNLDSKALAHRDGRRVQITRAGERYVETRSLLELGV